MLCGTWDKHKRVNRGCILSWNIVCMCEIEICHGVHYENLIVNGQGVWYECPI